MNEVFCEYKSDGGKSDVLVCLLDNIYAIHVAESKVFEDGSLEPITLPYAGESLFEETIEDCIEQLLVLRTTGYHVPDLAMSSLISGIR